MNLLLMRKNAAFLIFSNLISILISGVFLLVFPKYLSVTEFGYWQIYILITMYLSYASFGVSDGVYIRYSDINKYKENLKFIGVQYWFVLMMDLIITVMALTYLYYIQSDKINIFAYAALSCFLVVPKSLIIYFRQSLGDNIFTSKLLIIEKIIFMASLIIYYYFGIKLSIENLIYIDLFSKFIPLLLLFLKYPNYFVISKDISIKESFKEIKKNFSVGIIILFINFSTMIIIGILRIGIEQKWNLETFATISLMLNFSNFLIIFINSISLLVYPILVDNKNNSIKLKEIYLKFNKLLFSMLCMILTISIPISLFIENYLPKYSSGTKFLIIFLAIIVFDGKTVILSVNFLKVLRKEFVMLKINVMLILLTFIFYFLCIIFWESLSLTIFSMYLLIVFKSYTVEYYLQKKISVTNSIDLLIQIFIVTVIVFCDFFFRDYVFTTIIIFCSNICYMIINKKTFLSYLQFLSSTLKFKK